VLNGWLIAVVVLQLLTAYGASLTVSVDCHLVSVLDALRRCRRKAMAIVRRYWRRASLRTRTIAMV